MSLQTMKIRKMKSNSVFSRNVYGAYVGVYHDYRTWSDVSLVLLRLDSGFDYVLATPGIDAPLHASPFLGPGYSDFSHRDDGLEIPP
jgi:hypothetical protein